MNNNTHKKAIKIRMKIGCHYSRSLLEIESIFIDDCGFLKKENVYDFLQRNPHSIRVNIYPYPLLLPATSIHGEKYVRSASNDWIHDNLLKLPRE